METVRAEDTFVDIICDFDLEDLEDYDEYELEFGTTQFERVRDTSQDHVVTVKFAMPMDHVQTLPMALVEIATGSGAFELPADAVPTPVEISDSYANELPIGSTPYALVELGADLAEIEAERAPIDPEIWELGPRNVELEIPDGALPMPLYSVPFDRVDIDVVYPARESTEELVPPRSHSFTAIAILVAALVTGFVLALILI